MNVLAILALLLAPLAPAAAIDVPEKIQAWRADLEREFGLSIPIVTLGTQLSGDAAGVELVRKQLENENLRHQVGLMQAAMISERAGSADSYVLLVNLAWRATWEGFEEALLGHELGHAWLRARRLPAPAYQGGAMGCLAVHTGDIAQHVLIRAEMDRRGIDHRAFLMKNLDDTAAAMEQQGPSADPCAWARQAALWVDARLAFQRHAWPGRQRYEAAARSRFPQAAEAASEIVALLAGLDLNDRFVHRQALVDVFAILRKLAAGQSASPGN